MVASYNDLDYSIKVEVLEVVFFYDMQVAL